MTTVEQAIEMARQAAEQGKISASALENMERWLTEPRYEAYRQAIIEHIEQGKWKQLDDVFWTVIPFGTGGRRGRMYPFGSNAINERTIGESAQGLASYILEQPECATGGAPKCAIAYDTRHRSREFAELCASVMVANGFEVFFLDEYRATPHLSFAVRYKQCDCGIMVTASHNPPSDNAVKVYWSTGGQVLPPHDAAIIERVMSVDEIKTVPFAEALASGKVRICTQEIDAAYLEAVRPFCWPGPRDARIIYSPLHGVGGFAVLPVMQQAGFTDCTVFGPHAEPDGDFPNVPGHVSNPENKAVFDAMIEQAVQEGADCILATDPDCDRMGCAAPLAPDVGSAWETLTGNQIGALLTDYVCARMKEMDRLNSRSYVVKTLVTTELTRRVAASYGVRCEGNLHVGFKWIAGAMDRLGPDNFVFGTEESHGYLIGQYARDKDGAVACLLMAMLVAALKQEGKTVHQRLDELFRQHGCHQERLLNIQMEGSEGMAHMQKLMEAFRHAPPEHLGGIPVRAIRDYQSLVERRPDGTESKLDAPRGNMVMLDLESEGNYFAVRPSGTEPKVKFYMFTYLPPEESQDVAAARSMLSDRLDALEADIRQFAAQISDA
ncbi:MAG: phospho-sugar mutase [Planctomycetota bacterium]|nr:MAG: phospho-sugar mutase [Planctomycetota bacterium]